MQTFSNYINGEWVAGPTFENRNPANNDEVVGLFVKGTAADVTAACDAAEAAFWIFAAVGVLVGGRNGAAKATPYVHHPRRSNPLRWADVAALLAAILIVRVLVRGVPFVP